eukprot:scaffold43663_cov32-Tisochrysis_lutea.AAC.1
MKDMSIFEVRNAEAGPTRVPFNPIVRAIWPPRAQRPPPTIANTTLASVGIVHERPRATEAG